MVAAVARAMQNLSRLLGQMRCLLWTIVLSERCFRWTSIKLNQNSEQHLGNLLRISQLHVHSTCSKASTTIAMTFFFFKCSVLCFQKMANNQNAEPVPSLHTSSWSSSNYLLLYRNQQFFLHLSPYIFALPLPIDEEVYGLEVFIINITADILFKSSELGGVRKSEVSNSKTLWGEHTLLSSLELLS